MRGVVGMIIFLLLTQNGCIIVPHPSARLPGSRRILLPEEFKFIQPGSTTRETVLLKLGEPDYVLNQDRILIYQWATSEWVMAMLIGNYPAVEMPHNRYLRVELDACGIVIRRDEAEDQPLKIVNLKDFASGAQPAK